MPIYNPDTDALDIYSNGVLVGSLACGFQWDGHIYKSGDTCPDITGAWSKTSAVGTFALNPNNMQIETSGGTSVIAATVNKIDFSKYKKLSVDLTHSYGGGSKGSYKIGLSSTSRVTPTAGILTIAAGELEQTIAYSGEIDVSAYRDTPMYVIISITCSTATYSSVLVTNLQFTN